MKKFTLFLMSLLIVSVYAIGQIKLVVCQEGDIRTEFIASKIDSIIFITTDNENSDNPNDNPINPDDYNDTPEVGLPGEGYIRFLIDATAVDACYGLGIEGYFCSYDPDSTLKGVEFIPDWFVIDVPSMSALDFGNAKILLFDEEGVTDWSYQVASFAYDITGSEDYITLIDDYGYQNAINLLRDDIDNVLIKVKILEVNENPCTPDVPAGFAKFVFTIEGECVPDSVIFTGNFEELSWDLSDRVMTKQEDGTYVWEGEYPVNFEYKTIAMIGGVECWLEGANREVTVNDGAVIEFSGCIQGYCPGDEIVDPDDEPITPEEPTEGTFVAKPFSVSVTKTVTFSPGNLQYHTANDEWRFAPSQTDYIGSDNSNISSTYNGWIDLFGWGTGNNPTNTSTNYEAYSTFVDWGANTIGNDAPNSWRTLTYDEWFYLCHERSNYRTLKGVAQVNGVNGLILLPDNWICPSDVTFKPGSHSFYGKEYYAEYQSFSISEWEKLEASGAVFLPAVGLRDGYSVNDVQTCGYYWSATEYLDDVAADAFVFGSHGTDVYNKYRNWGLSVRLVQD